MKKQTLLCFALTAVVLFASAAFLPSNESEIYDQVVRLHILANSDSERDQALKLLVRDAVTARSEEIFGTYDAIDDVLADMPPCRTSSAPSRGRRSTPTAATCRSRPSGAAKAIPPASTRASAFRPAAIIRSACKSVRQRGKTGSACCFRRCACRLRRHTEALKATTLTENAIDVFLETNKPRYVFRFKLLEWFGW